MKMLSLPLATLTPRGCDPAVGTEMLAEAFFKRIGARWASTE